MMMKMWNSLEVFVLGKSKISDMNLTIEEIKLSYFLFF